MTRSDTIRLPVPVSDVPAPRGPRDCGFGAQLLGQAGARRGLRGGPPVLRGARAAYLSAQWSGAEDRRPPSGVLRRVEA